MSTFSLSPSVDILENDYTLYTKASVTLAGAYVGRFLWGPVDEPFLITNGKGQLTSVFGTPDKTYAADYLVAANFLAYGAPLYLGRAVGPAAVNAVSSYDGTTVDSLLVKNETHYTSLVPSGMEFIAKCPGTRGNGLEVHTVNGTAFSGWAYEDQFEYAPQGSDFCLVVVDTLGVFGDAGAVLERFDELSETDGDLKNDGTSAFYQTVINAESNYLWVGDLAAAPSTTDSAVTFTFGGGVDDEENASKSNVYALFSNTQEYDISAIIAPAEDSVVSGEVADIAIGRRDCLAFLSPASGDVVNNSDPLASVLLFRNTTVNKNSSYIFYTCNWKYQYDSFNQNNIWVPDNGDIAGLQSRLFIQRNFWESFAGYEYGQILNVIKLAWNPDKAQRDLLYTSQINPVISEKGEGTFLFGDKTGLTRPSAFNFVNVRNLFIGLEKSIALSAKYQLFKLNTPATRSRWKNQTIRFLRNIQSRGGLSRFSVICDDTNNPDQVTSSGQFVGDISIKPYFSINNVLLNFNALNSDVQFEEIEQRAT